ncbi:MAG: isocitrate lyase/phosphoenolpyruvate mutase family protein [Caulobacteraceae bacterium]
MQPLAVANLFKSLHTGAEILVLPNAWDAASARLLQELGARAIATSSAAVAWSHGYADGDRLPVPLLLASLKAITRVISIPLTADIEGGYSDDPAVVGETVGAVIDAGAVGVNLEDGRGSPDLLCAKIKAARAAADQRGAPLFINARIDVYLHQLAEGEAALEEALARAQRYREAGADGIFVPGPTEDAVISALAWGVGLPLNVMARAGVSPVERLNALGVRRLSSATGLFRAAFSALTVAGRDFLRNGNPSALASAGAEAPNFNAWFSAQA